MKDGYSFPVASYNLFKNSNVNTPVVITARVYACDNTADIQLPIFHYVTRDGMPDNDALLMLMPSPLLEK